MIQNSSSVMEEKIDSNPGTSVTPVTPGTFNTSNIVFIGDVHGKFRDLIAIIGEYKGSGISFIQLGDFGVGYDWMVEARVFPVLDEILQAKQSVLYVIRGNHDDPGFFKKKRVNAKFIRFVPDYSVMNISGRKILFIGGAISVDRTKLTPGVTYWRDEPFVLDKGKLRKVDLTDLWAVVTHTAPDFAPPTGFDSVVEYFAARDPSLTGELIEERKKVTKLWLCLKDKGINPKYWFYGHFHIDNIDIIDGTNFVLLGELSLYRPESAGNTGNVGKEVIDE